ncbi:ATP-binding protein [Kineococcus sp. NUM-3379]
MVDDAALAEVRLLGLPVALRARFVRHTEGLLRELSLVQIGAQQALDASLPRRLLELADEVRTTYAPFQARPAAELEAAEAAGLESCDLTYTLPREAGGFLRHLSAVLEEADEFCRAETHLLTLPPPPDVVAYRRWVFGEFTRQLAGEPPQPWTGGREGSESSRVPSPTPSAGIPAPPSGGPHPGEGTAPAGELVAAPLAMEPLAGAVSAARRHVREALRRMGAPELEESAELGVSELVTNALLHARTSFAVAVRRTPAGRVRIEVADSSAVPLQPRNLGPAATTGRGLRLVGAVSADWGVDPVAGGGPGKLVWFEPRETQEDEGEADAGLFDWSQDIAELS